MLEGDVTFQHSPPHRAPSPPRRTTPRYAASATGAVKAPDIQIPLSARAIHGPGAASSGRQPGPASRCKTF